MNTTRKPTISFQAAFYAGAALYACSSCAARFTRSPVPCDFPGRPQFPAKPVCPPTKLTADDALKRAWQFAPELRFHPLEDSSLIDPADWFAQAVISAPASLLSSAGSEACPVGAARCSAPASSWPDLQGLPEWNLNRTDVDFASATYATTLQNPALSLEEKQALIAGAPFGTDGRSSSSMVHSFFTEQEGNAWVFNFHPFYGWNGCSNQAFSTRLFRSTFDVEEYFLCPIGAHEMDLEFIGVYVCPADLEGPAADATLGAGIRRVQYSQHGWLDEFNCDTSMECPFEEGANSESGLVAYSGLFSHALYPRASSLWIYAQGDVDSLEIPPILAQGINTVLGDRIDGISVADRTAGSATSGRRWVPSATNVRHIPDGSNISADDEDAWALFPGSWGIDDVAPPDSGFAVTCVSSLVDEEAGHMVQGQCRRWHPSYKIVQKVTQARDAANTFDAIDIAVAATVPQTRSPRRLGPLFRDSATAWQPEEGAPIYNAVSSGMESELVLQCPAIRS